MGFPSLKAAGFNLAVAALVLLAVAKFGLGWRLPQEGGYDRAPARQSGRSAGVPAPGADTRTAPGWSGHAPAIAAKRPDEFRVVILGDATTLAAGVDIEAIITGLQQARPVEYLHDVRVIRLAVSGQDPRQYSRVLEGLGPDLQADLILVPQSSEEGLGKTIHIDHRADPGWEQHRRVP